MKKNGGSIINISSRLRFSGFPAAPAYSTSKAAVRNYTQSVALYCSEQGYDIRCNSISPGTIATPLLDAALARNNNFEKNRDALLKSIPVQRLGNPDDVAHAIAYLASVESSYITGADIAVDGGSVARSLS